MDDDRDKSGSQCDLLVRDEPDQYTQTICVTNPVPNRRNGKPIYAPHPLGGAPFLFWQAFCIHEYASEAMRSSCVELQTFVAWVHYTICTCSCHE